MPLPTDEELTKTFQHNLSLLPNHLRTKMLKVPLDEVWNKISIIENENGHPICLYHDNENKFHITSNHPLKEAKYWSDNLPIDDAGAIFIYGSGFGYPLFELLKRKQPNTIIMVFEQNLELFIALMHYFDLTPIIETQKFMFFLGDIQDFKNDFERIFNTEVFLYSTAPYVIFTPVAQRNFKNEYYQIHQYVFHELSLNIFYMGNDHYDTLLGFHNLTHNVKEVIENPYLEVLKDKYKNQPAFIISNGPSLDKNINHLKKVDGKGLLISTESAIIPLIKNQIKPDILSIVERTKDSFTYHFEGRDYPKDIALIALALIDPNIFPSFTGPRIPLFRNTESINIWMNQHIGDPNSSIDAGANVSHLAFEIAVYLGANPIVFVGQDFAYGPDGNTHSKYAVYQEAKGKKALNNIKSRPIVYVEGNDGFQLPSIQLWLDFKQGLERKIANHQEKMIINATEGGAKIKGTVCQPLKEVIEEYCKEPLPYKVSTLILESKVQIDQTERKNRLRSFIHSLHIYADKYRRLCQIATMGRIRAKKMIQLTKMEDISHLTDDLETGYNKSFDDLHEFMKDSLYFVFLQQILLVGFHQMTRIGIIHTKERIQEVFQIYDDLFYHLNLICQSVAVNYEMAANKLEFYVEENM